MEAFAQRHRCLEWVTPTILCALLFAQLMFSVRQLSQTADESTHLYAGYRYWKCGDFGFGSEHPPLPKLIFAAPLAFSSDVPESCAPARDEADTALDWLYGIRDWESVLFRARMTASLFAVGLCVLVWFVSRRMFGFPAAVLATTIFSFDPNVIAHGALVTTDMAVALAFLLAVLAYYRYFSTHSRPSLVLAGVATGVALTAKHSGIVVLPVLVVLAIADAFFWGESLETKWRKSLLNVGSAAAIICIAIFVVWAVYGFSFRAGGVEYWASLHLGDGRGVLSILHSLRLLPEPYLGGLKGASGLANRAGASVILGHTYSSGQWFFFPLVVVVKFTVAMLALIVIGVIIGFKSLYRERRREFLFLALPAAIFLAVCMTVSMNSGVRHLLPIVALLTILAAGLVQQARGLRWLSWTMVILIGMHAASSLRAFPNYISYSNEIWRGPAHLYEYLPNTDMGESYKQVRSYVAEHRTGPCWVITWYRMDPRSYGVSCDAFVATGEHAIPRQTIPPKMKGTVIVSSSPLSGTAGNPGGPLYAFAQTKPKDHIGGSAMLVYEGEFDTRDIATINEEYLVFEMAMAGNIGEALNHARLAVEISPEGAIPHGLLCRALFENRLLGEAKTECAIAESLLAKEPNDPWKLLENTRSVSAQLNAPITDSKAKVP